MAGESKSNFENRLRAEGRWEQFVARREELKAESLETDFKLKAKNAWTEAMKEFPPHGFATPASIPAGVPGTTPAPTSPKTVPAAAPPKPEKIQTVKLKDFVGKEADARTVVQWVFDHLSFEDVTPEMAPSAGAWGLFDACRTNYQIRFEFYKNIWPRLLPNKAQLEALERFEDDGSEIDDLIDKCAAAAAKPVLPEGAEGSPGESAVPQVADPAGREQPG